jgi:hypothetical protein
MSYSWSMDMQNLYLFYVIKSIYITCFFAWDSACYFFFILMLASHGYVFLEWDPWILQNHVSLLCIIFFLFLLLTYNIITLIYNNYYNFIFKLNI